MHLICIYQPKRIISSLDKTFFKELNKQQGLEYLIALTFKELLDLLIHGTYILLYSTHDQLNTNGYNCICALYTSP